MVPITYVYYAVSFNSQSFQVTHTHDHILHKHTFFFLHFFFLFSSYYIQLQLAIHREISDQTINNIVFKVYFEHASNPLFKRLDNFDFLFKNYWIREIYIYYN